MNNRKKPSDRLNVIDVYINRSILENTFVMLKRNTVSLDEHFSNIYI